MIVAIGAAAIRAEEVRFAVLRRGIVLIAVASGREAVWVRKRRRVGMSIASCGGGGGDMVGWKAGGGVRRVSYGYCHCSQVVGNGQPETNELRSCIRGGDWWVYDDTVEEIGL